MPGSEPRLRVSTAQGGKCSLQIPEAARHCEGSWLSRRPQVIGDSIYRSNNSLSFAQKPDSPRRYIMLPPHSRRWHQIMVSQFWIRDATEGDSGPCEVAILQGLRSPRMGWMGARCTPQETKSNQYHRSQQISSGEGWVEGEEYDRETIIENIQRGGCRGTSKPFSRINYFT